MLHFSFRYYAEKIKLLILAFYLTTMTRFQKGQCTKPMFLAGKGYSGTIFGNWVGKVVTLRNKIKKCQISILYSHES